MTRAYWREMISPDSVVPLSHDGYPKLLSRKKRRSDMLTSFCWTRRRTRTQSLQSVSMQRAEGATVVLVGDERQNI